MILDLSLGLLALAAVIALGHFIIEAQRLRVKEERTKDLLNAAQWLAEYHARYCFALQDYVLEHDRIGLPTLHMRLRRYRQEGAKRKLTLLIPPQEAPLVLRHAAGIYNYEAKASWPGTYREFDNGHLRMMEYLAHNLTVNLGRFTAPLTNGLTATQVMGVLEALESLLDAEFKRLTTKADDEEVLPREQ